MNKMVCEDCLTIFYSAAARTLVERRQPCPKCGGRLILDDEPPEPPLSLVTGEGQGNPGVERRAGGDRRRGDRRTGSDRRREPGRFRTER